MKTFGKLEHPNGDRYKTKKTTIGSSAQSKPRHGKKNRNKKSSANYRGQGR